MATGTVFHSVDRWPAELVRAVALAERQASAEGIEQPEAWRRVRAAYLAAGGDPEQAASEPGEILAVVAERYADWLYAPTRRRLEAENAWWRASGRWPPPVSRRDWPTEVIQLGIAAGRGP